MKTNMSVVTTFTLSSFNDTLNMRGVLFPLTLLCYLLILLVNITLIATVALDKALHEPMYVFLCGFCLNGLYGTLAFYPKFLQDLLRPAPVISYPGCLLQAWALYSFVCGDIAILAVMAYDRYVAICRPLEYHKVMSKRRLWALMCYSFVSPSCVIGVNVFLTSRLRLCSSVVRKFFCVNWVVVSLACRASDTGVVSAVATVTIVVYVGHCLFIALSYLCLIKTCRNSLESKSKFLQTCVPHLVSLLTFLVSILLDIISMRMSGVSFPLHLQNFLAMESLVVPPLVNPLIYGFKLTKIRRRILGYVSFRRKY